MSAAQLLIMNILDLLIILQYFFLNGYFVLTFFGTFKKSSPLQTITLSLILSAAVNLTPLYMLSKGAGLPITRTSILSLELAVSFAILLIAQSKKFVIKKD